MTRQCQLLEVGQTVRVESLEFCYRVTVLAANEPGPKLVEKGEDFIVLEDAQQEVQTRIPMHLIRDVVATPSAVVVAA